MENINKIDSNKHQSFCNRCLFDLWCAYSVRLHCLFSATAQPNYLYTPKHIYEIPVITAL